MGVALAGAALAAYMVYRKLTQDKEPKEEAISFDDNESCFSYLTINAQQVRSMTPIDLSDAIKMNRDLAKTAESYDYRPLIVSGPSGAGKGTLIGSL